ATRAYFMEKGEVRFSGPTHDLLERGDILRSVFLEGAASGKSDKSKVRASAARARPSASGGNGEGGEPVLELRSLTRRFGGITAVDDVSFTLGRHQILGLIGPNGAGKTTIFDLVSGLLPVDTGRILFRGVDITRWGADRRAASG